MRREMCDDYYYDYYYASVANDSVTDWWQNDVIMWMSDAPQCRILGVARAERP